MLRGRDFTWKGELLAAIDAVSSPASFRYMVTPGGYTVSVSMMNGAAHAVGR
jgi:hypothetical protein